MASELAYSTESQRFQVGRRTYASRGAVHTETQLRRADETGTPEALRKRLVIAFRPAK